MNIFILDHDIKKSAQFHIDKHCVKMILEHCQMLCTAVHESELIFKKLNVLEVPYKKSHLNHPCSLWVRANFENFSWLVAYTSELHDEFKYRFGKSHKSYITLENCGIITNKVIEYGRSNKIENLNPAIVMPKECITSNVVESYRNYYKLYKSHMFFWKNRPVPYWLS